MLVLLYYVSLAGLGFMVYLHLRLVEVLRLRLHRHLRCTSSAYVLGMTNVVHNVGNL